MNNTDHVESTVHRTNSAVLRALFLGCVFGLMVAVSVPMIGNAFSTNPGSHVAAPDTLAIRDLPAVRLDETESLADVLKQLADKRVVLVGETHTRYDHHLVQLEVLKHLYQKSPRLVLGVEWIQQPFQQHLDDYIAGRITESEMLHRTEYFNRWSYDYRLYQPIMQFARENRIPIIALNASTELSKRVTREGVENLPPELEAQLPSSFDMSDKAYEARLRKMFDLHPDFPGEFEDFVRGQLVWDESMAERAVEHLKDNPDDRMLIFAGSGHIMHGSGIPNRIKRRVDVSMATLLITEDYLPVSKDIADYLVLSIVNELEPTGLIGAYLETTGKLLVIKGFSHNSAVRDAGLEKGAVIVGVDDDVIETLADFKYAVLDKRAGDTIELRYLDSAGSGAQDTKSVNIELR